MLKVLFILLVCFTHIFGAEVKIYVEKMHCPLCTASVRKALLKVDGVESVKVYLQSKTAFIAINKVVGDDVLLKAVATTGYEGKIIQ